MWRNATRHLLRNRSGQVGLLIIGILLVVAIFAPIIAT
ncbi:MAG: ABC transporter permease, partial [Chloroflexota bacterium]|nr:ABC transporter permease [Chloroflexota bacterium]